MGELLIEPKIITDPDCLHKISMPTTHEEVERLGLVKILREANKTAWTKGAGLAAIQIGVPLRFAWYFVEGREGVLLNPVIMKRWGEDIDDEGCLSIPGKFIKIPRSIEIEYKTNGKTKRARGFLARLIQHEIDHMDGIIITDPRRQP